MNTNISVGLAVENPDKAYEELAHMANRYILDAMGFSHGGFEKIEKEKNEK